MGKRAKAYIGSVVALGAALAVACALTFAHEIANGGVTPSTVEYLALMTVFCAVCRSFPVYMRDNQALDVSLIVVLAVFLTGGTRAAALVSLASALVTFEPRKGGGFTSIYNTSPIKTLFNHSAILISIVLPGQLCEWLGLWTGTAVFPRALAPAAIFSVATFLVNAAVELTLFWINGELNGRDVLKTMLGLAPNVLAAMPLGVLIAVIVSLEGGMWLIFLMLAPLMLARYAWQLYLKSQEHNERLIKAFVSTIDAKDHYTQGHSVRVEQYAVLTARRLGLREKQIALLREGAVLHDIGKLGVDESILRKPGALSQEEWELMSRHPLIGVGIAREVGLNPEVIEMIRSHHERYDGKGYPNHLPISELPLTTRILGAVDAYDAMTSDRPYRLGMPRDVAFNILRKESGRQFDPQVVDALIAALEAEGK